MLSNEDTYDKQDGHYYNHRLTNKTIIVEVSGGVVQEVHGADDYIIVDWDNIESDDDCPELPEGYFYGINGVEKDD